MNLIRRRGRPEVAQSAARPPRSHDFSFDQGSAARVRARDAVLTVEGFEIRIWGVWIAKKGYGVSA